MTFNDKNFMLKNEPAKKLYAAIHDAPIYDFHCHLDPKAIYEDHVYDNIVSLWLEGDHYKWRLMRAAGVSEELITGNAKPIEKFTAWIKSISRAYGNALYHWSHLELKNIFGMDVVLKEENAEELYHKLNQLIIDKKISPRKLIKQARVSFIGTTDNPLDDLKWHEKISRDDSFDVDVAPTFRPDEAYVEHTNFSHFVNKLAEKTDIFIDSFDSFIKALEKRIIYFAEHGCRASDISFSEIVFENTNVETLDLILNKALKEEALTFIEVRQWQTGLFTELCRLYKANGFVTQVHFGAVRNSNSMIYQKLGADVGVDSIGDQTALAINLNQLLDELYQKDSLPKMIWYNLNPAYNTVLANTIANFQSNEKGIGGQLQFGAGWWFNDTKLGMIDQMNTYANQGIFANFVGMLTDSRSFLSFPRHDYFRRILASFVGEWIEMEEVPEDYEAFEQLVKDIAYNNAEKFFKK